MNTRCSTAAPLAHRDNPSLRAPPYAICYCSLSHTIMMKLQIKASLSAAQAVGLILIVLSVGVSYYTIDSLIHGKEQEALTQDALLLLDGVVSDFRSSESLQRRYLLTSDQTDFKAYEDARNRIRQGLPQFGRVEYSSSDRQMWSELESSINKRLELMESATSAFQKEGLVAATAVVGSDQNRQLHLQIESLVARIKTGEIQSLRNLRQTSLERAATIKQMSLVGGMLSFAILSWTSVMLRRAGANQNRARARLADSEAMSRAITESMAEGLVTATPDGLIASVNRAACTLFGYAPGDMQGHPTEILLPSRLRQNFRSFFAGLSGRASGFREFDTETLAQRSDGTEFPVTISFGDVEVDGCRLFTAVIRDITESKRSAQALRNSDAMLRQLADSVPALITYVDRTERFGFHNRAYEEAFGVTRQQVHGRTMLEVMGPEMYNQIKPYVDDAMAGHDVRYERDQLTASGEKREYVMNYFPRYGEHLESGEVIGIFSFGRDVTELKRIDRMKSEFVSTVSHELRTPLTSIRGSLGLVLGGITGVLPDKARGLLDIARNNCERLIRLINDILDSEKIESGKIPFNLQHLEMRPLMERALADNEGFAMQHRVKLVLRTSSQPLKVVVDSDRLLQVVTNLLSNAIKFSPPEGDVLVLMGRRAGLVRVEVRNTGPLIPEEFKGRIFQKFSQADASDTRQRGGTGLGLSIAKSLIERMNGSIGFTSDTETGTRFFFNLPEWHDAPSVSGPASLFGIERPRILVCEHDPDVARLIGLMLNRRGFDVDIAHTTGQGRDHLASESYAAITVDLKLPYEGGCQFIRELRQQPRTANLPVLVLSVAADEDRSSTDSTLGIDGWLTKPIDEKRLGEYLQSAIRKRSSNVV